MYDWLDKFNHFFGVTNFIFRIPLRRKYHPKLNKKPIDHAEDGLVYLASWVLVVLLYCLFIYFFVYSTDKSFWVKLKDLYARPPLDNLRDVYNATKASLFFNGVVVVLLYKTITSGAEANYLKDTFTHMKISGLIKALKIGSFDESSFLKEQNEKQLQIARKNVADILSSPSVERITIVTTTGFDFFGEGPALAAGESSSQKQSSINNGYLLSLVEHREKFFQILLLHPDSDDYSNRGKAYLEDGAHKPVESLESYRTSVPIVIEKLKLAYKKNKNIEVRLTKKNPQWKMIFCEREVWVQPILCGVRSDHTPMYGFMKSGYSMYHAFWNLSEEVWHAADTEKVDLSS